MSAVNLDELEHAALVVEDGEGGARALVARATGMIHLLNDDYMDEEAPLPADGGAADNDGDYVAVPPASSLRRIPSRFSLLKHFLLSVFLGPKRVVFYQKLKRVNAASGENHVMAG